MDKLIVVAEWRKYADEDLRTAKHMANNMWPTPDHIICFHCQQAAEMFAGNEGDTLGGGEKKP